MRKFPDGMKYGPRSVQKNRTTFRFGDQVSDIFYCANV